MRVYTIAMIMGLSAIAAPAFCGSAKELARADQLEVGQEKTQVNMIMGQPGNREFKDNREAWQYCARSGTVNKFVVVYFVNGRLEKLSTYNKRWLGGCSGQYKPVVWDTAPDAVKKENITQ